MRRGLSLGSAHDDEGFDDLPQTHLDDEEYEAFLERELDAQGQPRGAPRVGLLIFLLIVILLGVAVVAFR